MTPRMSLEVRSRNSSPSEFSNTSYNKCGNSGQGSLASQNFHTILPRTNIMDGNDINLSILNRNGLEDLEKH